MEAVDVRGRFVWHELMTRDAATAKSFYSKLTGWKPKAWPLDPSYTICHSDHGPTAGIFPMTADIPAEVPPHWLNYVGTRDVDGTAEAAVRAGGSVMKGPEDIEGAGRFAVLKDPQGALFAILDPENARPEPGLPPVGTFSWHELATSDSEAALAFYGALFGWEAMTRMDMGPSGTYLVFGSNGIQRGGMYLKSASMEGPPFWLPYASVSSADVAAKTASGSGAKVMQEPMDVPGGGRIAIIVDPTGAAFAVHSVAAAEPAPAMDKPAKSKPAAKAKPAAVKQAKPKARAKVKARSKGKAKSKSKAKTSTKAKAKVAKRKPVKKPAPKKAVKKKAKAKTVRRKK
jgi:predicted enzyme related to lactoylglutathione lyase